MSEYQYYEFLRLEEPLTKQQQAELRKISSRAEISSNRFVDEYEYGDLKAVPEELVSGYFDVGLYVANWGSRRLLVKLPRAEVDLQALRRFRIEGWEGCFDVYVDDENVVLDYFSGVEWGDPLEMASAAKELSSLVPIRQEVLDRDLRSLYLGWLAIVPHGGKAAAKEPPVPAGLSEPTLAQRVLMEFLAVDEALLEAATSGNEAASGRTIGELMLQAGHEVDE